MPKTRQPTENQVNREPKDQQDRIPVIPSPSRRQSAEEIEKVIEQLESAYRAEEVTMSAPPTVHHYENNVDLLSEPGDVAPNEVSDLKHLAQKANGKLNRLLLSDKGAHETVAKKIGQLDHELSIIKEERNRMRAHQIEIQAMITDTKQLVADLRNNFETAVKDATAKAVTELLSSKSFIDALIGRTDAPNSTSTTTTSPHFPPPTSGPLLVFGSQKTWPKPTPPERVVAPKPSIPSREFSIETPCDFCEDKNHSSIRCPMVASIGARREFFKVNGFCPDCGLTLRDEHKCKRYDECDACIVNQYKWTRHHAALCGSLCAQLVRARGRSAQPRHGAPRPNRAASSDRIRPDKRHHSGVPGQSANRHQPYHRAPREPKGQQQRFQ